MAQVGRCVLIGQERSLLAIDSTLVVKISCSLLASATLLDSPFIPILVNVLREGRKNRERHSFVNRITLIE